MAEDVSVGEGEIDAEFEEALAAEGSGRGKLRRELEKKDPALAQMFNEQTEAQKAWGLLIGKLIAAKSNDAVEEAFDWWAKEFNSGVDLKYAEKMVAFFHAVGTLGSDGKKYRILRRMYIMANTND